MGVCDTVSRLADAVETELKPKLPHHRNLLEILRRMPSYRDDEKLSDWESDFLKETPEDEDESAIGQITWEIFEFGRLNLYSAFDSAGTKEDYRWLCELLFSSGVKPPTHAGLSNW
jgi:hypothetical protein